jgi:hypothetical protein
VGWYDWLLFLHVAGAFVFGMAIATYWGSVAAGVKPMGGDPNTLANVIARPANYVVGAGAAVALLFGIWLVIYQDEYEIFDAWVFFSLLLWVVAVVAGTFAGRSYVAAMERSEPGAAALRRRGLLYHSSATLAFLAILVMMIFKPGA